MGYYEGWDSVWRDNVQVGWICPRCEKFVPKGEEHSCITMQQEPRVQMSETGKHEEIVGK